MYLYIVGIYFFSYYKLLLSYIVTVLKSFCVHIFTYFLHFRHCFVENMFRNEIIDAGMYHVLQEWYKFIEDSIHIRADLIGMSTLTTSLMNRNSGNKLKMSI